MTYVPINFTYGVRNRGIQGTPVYAGHLVGPLHARDVTLTYRSRYRSGRVPVHATHSRRDLSQGTEEATRLDSREHNAHVLKVVARMHTMHAGATYARLNGDLEPC